MLKSITRIGASLTLIFLCSLPASAQQGGDDVAAGGTDTGTDTGLGGGSFTELDAGAAFQAIDRGDTVGASQNTGQGFSEASDAAGNGGGGLGGLGGGFGGLGGFGGFGNLFGGPGTSGTQTAKPIIRTRLRSAIRVSPIPPQQRQRIVLQRFRNLPRGSSLRGVNVAVAGQTAVITGVVSSDRERRMSELLLRLEPGIRNVDNQVTVAQ